MNSQAHTAEQGDMGKAPCASPTHPSVSLASSLKSPYQQLLLFHKDAHSQPQERGERSLSQDEVPAKETSRVSEGLSAGVHCLAGTQDIFKASGKV